MNQVMINFTNFVSDHALELTLGFTALMVLAAFILLIVLIRRKPEDAIIRLRDDLAVLASKQERAENLIKDEMTANRKETAHSQQQARQELGSALKSSSESLQQRMVENIGMQKDQLDSFSKQLLAMAKLNEERLEAMRQTIATQLRAIQEDNTKKLEQMRATVDEKLQTTLEKRLGESFKQVSERLEQVYKGLGEMRNLATGVGDLKKVLTNVKTRGTWGEIRLSHILEQILTP
jgi:DNA recombination protein RmuC